MLESRVFKGNDDEGLAHATFGPYLMALTWRLMATTPVVCSALYMTMEWPSAIPISTPTPKPASSTCGTDALLATTSELLPTTEAPYPAPKPVPPPLADQATTTQTTYVAVINKALCANIRRCADVIHV